MPKAEKNDKLATDRSDNSGGGTARAMNAVASAAKAQSTKGSHSARSAKLSKKSSKGVPLAVSKMVTLAEENDFADDRTRVEALERQLEIQRSQFEQQMQQSAMAMEELFDQLTDMRKEKDVALVALQKALPAQHAISVNLSVVAEAVTEKPTAAAVTVPPATAATSWPTATATATAASLVPTVAEAPAVPMVTEAAVRATSEVGASIAEAGASTPGPVATAAAVEVPPAEVPCMHTHAHIHTCTH